MEVEKIEYIKTLITNKQSELRQIDRKFNEECRIQYNKTESELNLIQEILKDLSDYYSQDYQ